MTGALTHRSRRDIQSIQDQVGSNRCKSLINAGGCGLLTRRMQHAGAHALTHDSVLATTSILAEAGHTFLDG